MSIGDVLCQFLQRDAPQTQPDPAAAALSPSVSLVTRLFPSVTADSRFSSSPWWDHHRTSIMALQGAFLSGPWGFVQFTVLEKLFPGRSRTAVLQKVATSIVIAPISICLTFTGLNFLYGRPWASAVQKIESDLPRTYISGAFYWPFISAMNFRFTPLEYRPLVGSMAGVLWNIYLSFIANRHHAAAEGDTEEKASAAASSSASADVDSAILETGRTA